MCKQPKAECDEHKSNYMHRPVAARLAEQDTPNDTEGDLDQHGGEEPDARLDGRRAQDRLEVDGQEEEPPVQQDEAEEGDEQGGGRGALLEGLLGEGRVLDPGRSLVGVEHSEAQDAEDEGHDYVPRGPGVPAAAPREGNEEGRDGRDQDGGADVVDAFESGGEGSGAVKVDAEEEEEEYQGAAADREVDVKDPSPAGTFNEGCERGWMSVWDGRDGVKKQHSKQIICDGILTSSNKRANSSPQAKDGKDQRHVIPSLAKRDEITDNNLNHEINPTAANTLYGPAGDQHGRAVCAPRDAAAEGEDGNHADHHIPPPKDVGKLAD